MSAMSAGELRMVLFIPASDYSGGDPHYNQWQNTNNVAQRSSCRWHKLNKLPEESWAVINFCKLLYLIENKYMYGFTNRLEY